MTDKRPKPSTRTRRPEAANENDVERRIDQTGKESFPASDPPAWGPLHPGKPARHPDPERSTGKAKKGVVSRRDERGVPYPGDWPNPVSDIIRGCF